MTKALDAALDAVSKIGKPEVVAQHAPTPYHIESVATSAFSARVFICDANGSRVTDINCGDDDAKFIVSACNAHDALVMAAELALNIPGLGLQARRTIEEALKLAKGE